MSTKNFVPRENLQGGIGTEQKKWSKIYSDTIYTNNITGTLNGTSTKAIQDKNGKDITTYLNKEENITLKENNSNISNVGNIVRILNDYYTKINQIQGTSTYSENPPTSLKSLIDILDTKAPVDNPSLTGNAVAPTPSTEDNSTKIATTAFVNNLINLLKENGVLGGSGDGIVASSLTQNGWVKFKNGLILQWGYGSASKNATIHSVGEIKATLPIRINTLYCAIGNMGGSAACVMQVNLRNNTQIGGSWDSFQYNTPNPARWRYILIGA